VLTIIDTVNLPGQFAFSATNYNVTEGGGSGVSPVLVTVVRTNGSSGIVSVHYTTLDGTASPGIKYISTNGSLTFGDGVTSQSFYVQAVNTTTAEGPEYLYVALSSPTGGASLAQTNATVTILNTNVGIAFVLATNTFTEPFGQGLESVILNVVRFNNTNVTTTVGYYTTNDASVLPINMAVVGTNYYATNGTLVFNPGDSIKTHYCHGIVRSIGDSGSVFQRATDATDQFDGAANHPQRHYGNRPRRKCGSELPYK